MAELFEDNKERVIFVDFGLFLHKAVFAMKFNPKIPPTYTCVNMILSNLKTIGIKPTDLVVVAIDGRGSWRRDLDPSYKANRRTKRDESGIDWYHWFGKFNELVENLKISTPFNYLRLDKIEADDIIAVGCRYFAPKECIIISSDTDFHQLMALDNVKIFSPITKKYKVIEGDPYQLISKKIKKETTDNLKAEVTNEFEFEIRNILVNLLKLPDEVEEKVLDKLRCVGYNDFDLYSFPFKGLINSYMNLYNTDKVETYEKAIKRATRKVKGKKKNGIQTSKEIV